MKKYYFIASAALIAMSSCTAQTSGYKINGTVNDTTLNGATVYLVNINSKDMLPVDSAVIENASFSFASTEALAEPEVMSVHAGNYGAGLILENGKEVNVIMGQPGTASDNGGLNDKFAKLMENSTAKAQKMQQTYASMMQSGATPDSIQKVLEPMQNEILDLYNQTAKENKDNILGAYIFAMTVTNYTDVKKLEIDASEFKYANKFATHIDEHKKSLESSSTTSEGKMFIDFDGKNIDGTAAKLSDYVGKGKFVLVDFWASWCGPCRREIPNLVELEKKFGGDKFMVLGVNVWDKEPEFKKALENEKINYAQLYASDNNDATTIYSIKGIPQIILFGPDGTILKRDLRGEQMKKFVEEQLSK
ncbi:MAG: AhpC/TSA family protein [Bacteroidales bacterium]|nr:AhpC/TSA family protein [Bacteroidales bacterium]